MQTENEIIVELIEKFKDISSKGWITSRRSHNTGIGKTFEDLLDKEEDNLSEPDFKGIEIKTHRSRSSSYTSLFTCAPDGPKPQENTRLREKFGKSEDDNPNLKVLHTSMFADRKNTYLNQYQFIIDIDRENERLYILVYDMNNNIIEKTTYWTFEVLNKCLCQKLKTLAFIAGDSRISSSGVEEFNYKKLGIYKFKSFEKFLHALENGIIMVDLRIGVYKSGNNIGKTHDHGTAFRIKAENLEDIYDLIELVEN